MTVKELDKKQQAALKADFALHVALIQKQDGATQTNARWLAWTEGQAGLARRLGQGTLPLKG